MVLTAFTSVAFAVAPPPIVNGEVAPEVTGVAMLVMTNGEDDFAGACSGTLVANQWVLTAAHCVQSVGWYEVEHVRVTFADAYADASGTNTLEAEAWHPHEHYDPYTSEFDLAMVKLPSAIGAEPVPLAPEPPTDEDKGEDFRLVGYGATGDYDYSLPDSVRRAADVPLYDYDDHLLYTFDPEDDQNACYGDSGGPIFRLYPDGTAAIAGVMDYVSGCNGGGLGASRTDRAINWIGTYTAGYTVHETRADEGDTGGDTGDDSGVLVAGPLCASNPGGAGFAAAVAAGVLALSRRRSPIVGRAGQSP